MPCLPTATSLSRVSASRFCPFGLKLSRRAIEIYLSLPHGTTMMPTSAMTKSHLIRESGSDVLNDFISQVILLWVSTQVQERWTSTGMLLCVRTFTVSLPRTIADIPRRPCEAMTMRSQPLPSAVSMIAA